MFNPAHRKYYEFFNNSHRRVRRNRKADLNVKVGLALKGLRLSNTIEGWHFYFKKFKTCIGVQESIRGEKRFIKQVFEPEPIFSRPYNKTDDASSYLKGFNKIKHKKGKLNDKHSNA
jgi:hypothetical protein